LRILAIPLDDEESYNMLRNMLQFKNTTYAFIVQMNGP